MDDGGYVGGLVAANAHSCSVNRHLKAIEVVNLHLAHFQVFNLGFEDLGSFLNDNQKPGYNVIATASSLSYRRVSFPLSSCLSSRYQATGPVSSKTMDTIQETCQKIDC